VTAFSNSPDKEEQARRFGAHHFINGCDPTQLEAVANHFDFLLCTATGNLPWAAYLTALKPRGKLCVVGVPPSDIAVPVLPLILGQKTICGSPIGSPANIEEMLEHAASFNVQTQVELFPMTQANEGLERVRANRARYRVVLAN
jgi:uncharacterized zinc-type alcohol dehydrogenase-like protein